MTAIVVITQEDLQGFTHPALDLKTGELIELAAEPVPEQLELALEVISRRSRPSREVTVES